MSFQDTGNAPRLSPIRSVLRTTATNGAPALTTQAGYRQFEWNTTVRVDPTPTDSYQVGFIQNLLGCTIQFKFTDSRGDSDPAPIKMAGIVNPLPILDSKVLQSNWSNGRFRTLGSTTLSTQGVLLPPGISATTTDSEASLSDGDDPGGTYPLVSPLDSTRRLTRIMEQFRFVTWLAVRLATDSPSVLSSYRFLRNAIWTIERQVVVYHDSNGILMNAILVKNTISLERGAVHPGKGDLTPVLSPPIANNNISFQKTP